MIININFVKRFKISYKEEKRMALLQGKKAILIGDRDGIPAQAMAECVQSAGAEVIYASTECFV